MSRTDLKRAVNDLLVPTVQATASTLGTTIILSVVRGTEPSGASVCFETTLTPWAIPPASPPFAVPRPEGESRRGLGCTWPAAVSGQRPCLISRFLTSVSVSKLMFAAQVFLQHVGPAPRTAVVVRFRTRGWRARGGLPEITPDSVDCRSWVRDGHPALVEYIDCVLGGRAGAQSVATAPVVSASAPAEGPASTPAEGSECHRAQGSSPGDSTCPPPLARPAGGQPPEALDNARRKRPAPGASPRPAADPGPRALLRELLDSPPLTSRELLEEAKWWAPVSRRRRAAAACHRADADVNALADYVHTEIRAQGGVDEGGTRPRAGHRTPAGGGGGGGRGTHAASPAAASVSSTRPLLSGCSVNDLGTLLGDDWLSSNAFAALLPLLSKAAMEGGGRLRQCALPDCAQAGAGTGLRASADALVRKERLAALRDLWKLPPSLDRVLLPWNVGGNHWVLVGVDAVYKQVVVANTLAKGCPRSGLKRPIGNLFREVYAWPPASQSLTDFSWKFPDIAQQSDSHSCGVLVLALIVDNLLQPWDPACGESDWAADIEDRVTESWVARVSRSRRELFRFLARTAVSESPPVSNNRLLHALWRSTGDAAEDDRGASRPRTRGPRARSASIA